MDTSELLRWPVLSADRQNATTLGDVTITNAPTESINNLIKRIKRIGFGFRNFENYRIRVLLYAGKPNWRVLGSIVVR